MLRLSGHRGRHGMQNLLQRLRERKLVQWALAYLAGAWVVLQVLGLAADSYDWPHRVMQIAFSIIAVGFVIALVLAWYHGERGAQRVTGTELLILAVLLAIGGGLLWRFGKSPASTATPATVAPTQPSTATSIPAKSIAVLPFENLSEDKGNAYFADGIQDEILTALAKIGDLKVISRTSTRKYASAPDNLPEIARQLGVATILEGSVQKAGERVRIIVQLIEAAGDNHIWAQTYDRTLDDVFGVESEVAQKIAGALHAAISGKESAALAQKPTANAAAYAAYLKARALLAHSTFGQANVEGIIAAYQEVVALDPGFALAWTGLVRQQVWMYWQGYDPTPERLALAKAALDRALALAPEAPQVQAAQGWYEYYARYDLPAALAAFRNAQHGLPNDVDVWMGSGLVGRRLGRYDEALADFRHARELDPNDESIAANLVDVLRGLLRFPEAIAAVDAGLALNGNDALLQHMKVDLLWNQGQLDNAEKLLAAWNSQTGLGLADRATQAMYRRDFAAASGLFARAVAAAPEEITDTSFGGYIPTALDWRLQQALCESRLGHAAETAALYREVQTQTNARLANKPGNVHVEAALRVALGEALAGLGEPGQAVAEGRRAAALIPESSDKWEGSTWQRHLARILVLSHETDAAILLIGHLLTVPGFRPFTPATLRLDPVWDPIRNDPRFQALLKQHASAQPQGDAAGTAHD
jgi:TolB-like protein